MPEAGNISANSGVAKTSQSSTAGRAPTVYHIPVCPFSQRLEILLTLKGYRHLVDFHVVDITRPRPEWLLEKTRGTTALPVLETEDGGIIKESMVILGYLEDRHPEPAVAQRDPYRRAVEGTMNAMEGGFTAWGYRYVLNQDAAKRDDFKRGMLEQYARLDEFLTRHNPDGTFLFERFGLAETVFASLFMRFWFLEYYEGFDLPNEERYARVRRWREACLAHPAA
ncbi:MAG: glutathione S-transferase family protein, partial [Rubrobacter sp.]|nr:glutathione S-transferase family protein [Rubrobacter sp.]